ncbi:MAG: tRNA pseudouridine(55) synthase TruB [Bacillota bacterium]
MSDDFIKNGIVNILKPTAMTSRDIVGWTKKTLDCRKAGHTGTLDPLAAGVLPVCLNKATKVIPHLPEQKKEYIAEMTLGVTTRTLDKEGDIVNKNNKWKRLSIKQIKTVFSDFNGEIDQIPPMFSAIKVNGKRLYEIARKNKEVTRASRRVILYKLEILKINLPYIQFKVECSKGTYIRALVRDIGEKLETGAHLSFLVRTSSGPFTMKNAFTLKEIDSSILKKKNLDNIIIPLDLPLNYPEMVIKEKSYKKAFNGNMLFKEDIKKGINPEKLSQDDNILIYDINNNFIAIYRIDFSTAKTVMKAVRVFS